MNTILLSLAIAVVVIQVSHSHHNNGTCSIPGDCHEGECCVIPTQTKYVLPTCQKMGDLNSTCRPGNKPEDTLLPLRPGTTQKLKVVGAYRAICPCLPNLSCNSGVCGK